MDLTKRTKLKRLGSLGYRGYDYDQKPIHVAPGETFECSEARATRLLADYPAGFEVVGETGAEVAAPPAESASGVAPPTTAEPTAARGRRRKAKP